MTQTCERCKHWLVARPGDYRAPCALGYGRTAFNDTCRAWEAMEHAELPQQSACRGMTVQEWQRRLTGKG